MCLGYSWSLNLGMEQERTGSGYGGIFFNFQGVAQRVREA